MEMSESQEMKDQDRKGKNAKALAFISLTCAALLIPIAPIICGMIALRRSKTSPCGLSIKTCAWIGTIIGSLTIPVSISLAYVFYHLQEPERFQSSSSFSLTPPPAILNLQSVERENHLEGLIAKHAEELQGMRLRINVTRQLDNNPEYKKALLAPFDNQGTQVELGSAFSYHFTQSGTKSRPRFIITSDARSALGAKYVADVVQKEYEKLHKSTKSERIEFVKQTLEDLLDTSLTKERRIVRDMTAYKKMHGIPYPQDEKNALADTKQQFAKEITQARIEQIRINSLLRQILAIKTRIGTYSSGTVNEVKNDLPEDDFSVIEEFFEIDAIKQFGNVPALRQTLNELTIQRRDLEEVDGLQRNAPEMLLNQRRLMQAKDALRNSVTSAIEELRDKCRQLSAHEMEFANEMEKVQRQSEQLSEIEDTLKNFEREMAVVRRSTEEIHDRLNEVNIEQALPFGMHEPLRRSSIAYLPGSPYFPDKRVIFQQGMLVFAVVFIALLGILFLFYGNFSTQRPSFASSETLSEGKPSGPPPEQTKAQG